MLQEKKGRKHYSGLAMNTPVWQHWMIQSCFGTEALSDQQTKALLNSSTGDMF